MISDENTELEMFRFFEMTPDLVCIASREGFFKKINNAVTEKLGYSREELMSRKISSFIHPDDKEITARTRNEMLDGKVLINFDNRYITKSGTVIWLNWTSIYIPDKEVVFAIAKDITTRKRVEKEVEDKFKQFKNLAAHFKESLEKDKKNLAAELHEQLAQLAWVVKVDLNWMSEHLSNPNEETVNRLQHATSVTEMLIDSIRKISYTIGPGMLEDMGLNETLRSLSAEFTKLNGIPCTFESTCDDHHLTREIQLDLYRICQESLKNVAEHAEASNVKITLKPSGNEICLSVRDNGKGFEIAKLNYTPGLTSMRERAASVNGVLKIESRKGKGTNVSVTITAAKTG